MSGATEIQSSVLYFSTEFEKLEAAERKCQGPFRVKWAPPVIRGYLHDQHHGAFFPETKGGGLVFVVRDKNGDVLAVGAGDIRCAALDDSNRGDCGSQSQKHSESIRIGHDRNHFGNGRYWQAP